MLLTTIPGLAALNAWTNSPGLARSGVAGCWYGAGITSCCFIFDDSAKYAAGSRPEHVPCLLHWCEIIFGDG